MATLRSTPAWSALLEHHKAIKDLPMRDLFAQDAARANRFSIREGSIFLDYSKNRITDETLSYLLAFARQADIEGWRECMFSGKKINHTEDRAVLHTALRLPADHPDIKPEVAQICKKMHQFVTDIHTGNWRGYSGKTIRQIVNIGIGGSDLGPLLLSDALQPYRKPGINVAFISNIDAYPLLQTLNCCDPETTLFIIASKSFTTLETQRNAEAVRQWFLQAGGGLDDIKRHFIAVTNNIDAAEDFGIAAENVFPIWNWVGGRYSLWSAMGLPVALSIGMAHFNEILNGAWGMDQHFLHAPLESNIPVILALLGIWYINFFQSDSLAVIPYDQRLQYLPDYLQQLDMESNGKQVNRRGERVDYATGPIVWGTVGTNAQHAYFQLLHQGTCLVPIDFILAARHPFSDPVHHQALVVNCLAQSEALMQGKRPLQLQNEIKNLPAECSKLAPYLAFEGNRPSNTILLDELTPETMGMLIALYEHKVFVQGILWEINSFDQWGVEYGKRIAGRVDAYFHGLDSESAKKAKSEQHVDNSLSASTKILVSQLQERGV